jgi:hypothetical protein
VDPSKAESSDIETEGGLSLSCKVIVAKACVKLAKLLLEILKLKL